MSDDLIRTLRRLFFQVHLWLGVGLAVLVIPLGLTGSALVFSQELNRALAPQRYATSGSAAGLAPSVYLAAAKSALGDRAKPTELRLPMKRKDPVTVTGRTGAANNAMGWQGRPPSSLTVWMEPKDARVLDVADPRGGPVSLIHRLHGSLNITPAPGSGPGIGRIVVGWLGVAMAVSSLTGLWLWWPRGRVDAQWFGRAFRWSRSPLTVDNLHHLIGFWLCLPLLFLSLTGVYIAFPQQSHALFGVPAPAPQRRMDMDAGPGGQGAQGGGARKGRRGGGERMAAALTIDQAVVAAKAARAGAEAQVITLPTRRAPAWKIEFADKTPAVLVDAASGAVTAAPPEPVRRGDPISSWMRQTHEGEALGPIWTWLAFAAGFAPAILGVTGIWLWLVQRNRRKAVAAA